MRKEIIGNATLYLGDCREILPTLGQFDACVTDPPYGIKADETPVRGIFLYEKTQWDRERPSKETFDAILSSSKHQIIWGGNYFTDFLPPSMGWLIWNKITRDFSLADGEMAWCSQWKALRIFDLSRAAANQDVKQHPTQKPINIMEKCIATLPDDVTTIVDPFMGSGTTGVATLRMRKQFTGIEMNEHYFDVACKRISEASKQESIF